MGVQLDDYRLSEGLRFSEAKKHKKNPLDWWKDHHQQFPEVWKLAEGYLGIPATSAPSERAFSSSGNIVTLRRCRLKGNLVENCVIIQKNLYYVQGH